MQAAVEAARGTQTPAANVTPDRASTDTANADAANADAANTDTANADAANTDTANADTASTDEVSADEVSADKSSADRAGAGPGGENREPANGSDESPEPITEPLPRVRAALSAHAPTPTRTGEQSAPAADGTTVPPDRPGPPWPAQDRPAAEAGARPAAPGRPAALERAIAPRRLGRQDRGALPRREPGQGRTEPPSRSVPRRAAEPGQASAPRPSRPRAALPAPAAPAGLPAQDKQAGRKKRPAQQKRSPHKRRPAQDESPAQTGWPAQGGWPAETGLGTAETPDRPAGRKVRASRPRVVGVAAVAVVLVAAGTVAAVLMSHSQAPTPAANRTPGPATTASRAAAWVASQVSHSAVVACDQVICSALATAHFPQHNLRVLKPTSSYPAHSDVVVVTPKVQRQFGSSLATIVAPSALAQFGHGATTISIRVVAKQGAAAYKSALAADLKLRRAGGTGLLASHQVTASAPARKDLISGRVDARLIIVLTALASVHPVDIVSFGTVSGASTDVPLRMVDIALDDAAAKLKPSAYQQFLNAVLHAQPTQYAPLTAGPVGSGQQSVFQIQFSAPSPLGLLGPQGP